ncbi:MAG: hypothetical protein JXR56_04770, partial [Candidatus Cloacimonetes bacterium]|nr:hypothetical protein [Candidatus Cloacimonadota bacterium]
WFSFLIGFIRILWDSRQQSFADKLSRTLIIPRNQIGKEIPEPTEQDEQNWRRGKVIVYLAIVVLLVVNVIWQYEPPLLDGAEVALKDFAPEENPTENGFYSFSAFAVPADQSPYEVGMKRTIEMNKSLFNLLERNKISGLDDDKVEWAIDTLSIAMDDLVYFNDGDFNAKIREKKEMLVENFKKYDYLQDRYEKIPEYKRFESKIIPDVLSPVPRMVTFVIYHRLYCLNFFLEYTQGNRDVAISRIYKSDDVCTYLLENADNLIMKLVAVILTNIHQNMIQNLIVYEDELDPRLYKYVLEKKDFSKQAMSLRKAFMDEYNRGIAFIVRIIDSSQGMMDYSLSRQDIAAANPPFIKANCIANYSFKFREIQSDLSEESCFEMSKSYARLEAPKISFLEYINNPLGVKGELSYSSQFMFHYIFKTRDLQLRNKLLQAAAEIKMRKLDGDEIQQFLVENQNKWGNLYEEIPFNWDNVTRELSFSGPLQDELADERKIKL